MASIKDHLKTAIKASILPSKCSEQYVMLDSFSKLHTSRPEVGEFAWHFMSHGSGQSLEVHGEIKNVVQIQICEFAFPILLESTYLPTNVVINGATLSANNDVAGPPIIPVDLYLPSTYNAYAETTPSILNPYTQLPYNGRFNIQIRETGIQAYNGAFGTRYNFECMVKHSPEYNLNPAMTTAIPVWDIFMLTEPIRDLHGITLTFRNPDHPLKFEPDVYFHRPLELYVNAGTNYVRIKIQSHNLLVGDRIFITGCATTYHVFDAYINRIEGHAVASPTALPQTGSALGSVDYIALDPKIAVPVGSLADAILLQLVTVYIAKRRIRIPMKFRMI